ncbi:MAG: prephenate dehydrogenase/arogenate dehydrogenase family protein, partial [Lachnospiraceae bacterium]|nr:prephenate dehydrogenase/arogenate dehydrogenase family protein [Lachnospiraceae bacterium]
ILSHKEHDYVTAAVSHVPHLVAAALANLVHDHDSEECTMKLIAAGGFKDITRIASSSPDMWESICMSNTENIVDLLDDYICSLQTISKAVRAKQLGFTYDLFKASKEYRDSFADAPKGPIKKIYACYVDIPDEAGALAAIATLLAKADISIKNIGIVHNREFEEGVLRVEFYEEAALAEAVSLLQGLHYAVYQRK